MKEVLKFLVIMFISSVLMFVVGTLIVFISVFIMPDWMQYMAESIDKLL